MGHEEGCNFFKTYSLYKLKKSFSRQTEVEAGEVVFGKTGDIGELLQGQMPVDICLDIVRHPVDAGNILLS
jgi:hypothetical protein